MTKRKRRYSRTNYPKWSGEVGRSGLPRMTRRTESEVNRARETWSGRIGTDLRQAIRELAKKTGLTQGQIGRILISCALDLYHNGDLDLENGRIPREKE